MTNKTKTFSYILIIAPGSSQIRAADLDGNSDLDLVTPPALLIALWGQVSLPPQDRCYLDFLRLNQVLHYYSHHAKDLKII